MVSSYCAAVTPGAAVKRARGLVLRASITGAADGLVVAIDGLLRVDAPDRADLQPSTSYRVAWRARNLSQKHYPIYQPSRRLAPSQASKAARRMMHAHEFIVATTRRSTTRPATERYQRLRNRLCCAGDQSW